MLKIENLRISYENKIAVDGVSLSFHKGSMIGLIGPNGAGKSTLLKTCIGLISEFSGSIEFDKKSLQNNRFWVKQHAVYAPENAELLPYLNGLEFLNLVAKIYNKESSAERIEFFVKLLGLDAKKNDLITDYSHGMRQKLAVAAALLPDPEYIFLDEALNGMDSVSLFRLLKYLKQEKKEKVIILSSHNVEMIHDYCDDVFVIHQGRIARHFDSEDLMELRKEKLGLLNNYISIIED
jgi:ABC-2 type transport system ATP-binding protein